MTNQEILDNAPEGACSINAEGKYWGFHTHFGYIGFDKYGAWTDGENSPSITRSLSDIREIEELKSEKQILLNREAEFSHAMELIGKIATTRPFDTAILEVVNCYRAGEMLKAHNLEQQAKALNEYAYSRKPLTKRGLNLESIALSDKAKELGND